MGDGTGIAWVMAPGGCRCCRGSSGSRAHVAWAPEFCGCQLCMGISRRVARASALHGCWRCIGASIAQVPALHGHQCCMGTSIAWAPALHGCQHCMGASVASAPHCTGASMAQTCCMGTSVAQTTCMSASVAWAPVLHGCQRCTDVLHGCQRCMGSGARSEPVAVRKGRAALGIPSPKGSATLSQNPGAGEVPPPARGLWVPETGLSLGTRGVLEATTETPQGGR